MVTKSNLYVFFRRTQRLEIENSSRKMTKPPVFFDGRDNLKSGIEVGKLVIQALIRDKNTGFSYLGCLYFSQFNQLVVRSVGIGDMHIPPLSDDVATRFCNVRIIIRVSRNKYIILIQ
jgi:hypothetical protein